ncbi:MAG: T9SS type A sorting domain-containing protein [Saprospiraceae bacterium]|nr:T9SS type A sorting domain-containing protein [Saprospiraceae bacterium]
MKLTVTCLLAMLLFYALPSYSQSAKDATIQLTVSVNTATPSVTLTWPNPNPSLLYLYRREKDSPDWFILIESASSTETTFTDTQVTLGATYEYGVLRQVNNVTSFGFAMVPIEAPVVDERGDLTVFIEEALTSPLATELERLRKDLVGDGWDIQWRVVPSTATVASIKTQIVSDYNANGTDAVMLFGDLPVPYSGNSDWDGHDDHQGAWPADAYYGDVQSSDWTDVTVNTNNNAVQPSRPQTINVPGDGKFDQDIVPSPSEIAVGRIDFSNLNPSTFGTSIVELYRRYLDKNHNWRSKLYTVNNKTLVDDNFGYFGGEAFASDGYRNGYGLVGPANVVDGDFFNDTDNNDSYLYIYGCGGGTYNSAAGVGTSAQFGTDTINAVFSHLFGSYHGDWDYSPDPFLVSAIASKGGLLTCSWAGRPHWFTHHLGGGETMGYSALQTNNGCDNVGYFSTFGDCGPHVNLMGDPTVRAHNVTAVPSVAASQTCNQVSVTWQASSQPNLIGYHVYRSNRDNGGFVRLSPNLVTTQSFVDNSPILGNVYYMVKTVVREQTPTGIYFNTSTGTTTLINVGTTTPPTVGLPSTVQLSCTSPSYQINTCGPGLSCTITGPGITAGTPPLAITQAGVYTVTVSDAISGCTNSATLTVTLNNSLPPTPTATAGQVNCQAQTVQLNGSSTAQGLAYSWTGPNGFTSNQQNPVVSEGGAYTLYTTNTTTGCSSSVNLNVPSPAQPNATATGGAINCAATSVQLQGGSTSQNVSYSWAGPNGYSSSLQNPTVNAVGNYVLTVTTAAGCTASASASVSIQNNIPAANPSAVGQLTCVTTQTTINANPDQAGYNFAWTGPNGFTSNLQNPSVNTAGTYTLVVTDPASACNSSSSVVVTQNLNPPTGITAELGTVNCAAQTFDLQGDANETTVSYAWNGPNGFTASQQNPVVNQAGTYVLTVTNTTNGCASSASVTVPSLVLPTATAVGGTLTCTTTSVQVQGSFTPSDASFAWTGPNGFTSDEQNPSVSVVGTYLLTTTVASGCTATATAVVIQSGDFPVAAPSSSGFLPCNGGQVTLSANPNQAGYDFLWSGPGGFSSTNQNPSVGEPGLYFVQVTNTTTGCKATYSTQVSEVQLPDINLNPTTFELTCSTTELTLNLTGICDLPGIACTLNGQPIGGPIVTINTAGPYELVVTNVASGCSASETLTVTASIDIPSLNIDGDLTLNCAGDLTTLTALSTTPGVTYAWGGLGSNPVQIVSSGTYTVTATGPNGCSSEETVEVTAPPSIMLSLSFVNECNGSVSIAVTATGGVAPYQFQTIPAGPLPSGATFTVIATDFNGCVETISGNIPALPAILTATANHTDETVLGQHNGTATAQATGGTPPYQFKWSNNATTATINNLAPGTYTCTVTDGSGCTSTVSVTVLEGTNGTADLPGLRDLRLSPNPTSGHFTLSIALENPLAVQVELLDAMGRVLSETKPVLVTEKTWQFDLGFAPAGVYYCKVQAEGNMQVLRVVKMD